MNPQVEKSKTGNGADTGGPATRQERAAELTHKARQAITLAQLEDEPLAGQLRELAQLLINVAVAILQGEDDEQIY